MPEGMTCEGEAAGVQNLCVVRVRNPGLAGPFGGAAAFTQSEGAKAAARKKRAVDLGMVRGGRTVGERV